MSHHAIVKAVKERKKAKRNGTYVPFHYHTVSKPIMHAIVTKPYVIHSLAETTRKYKQGCHNECFCCSPIGVSKLKSSSDFPSIWETQQGVDNMIFQKRCHSRLNHRQQFSGIIVNICFSYFNIINRGL